MRDLSGAARRERHRSVALVSSALGVEIVQRCDLEGEAGADVACDLGYSAREFYRLRRAALRTLTAAFDSRSEDIRAEVRSLAAGVDARTKVRLARAIVACAARASPCTNRNERSWTR